MAFNIGGEVLLLREGCFFLLERIVDTRISVIKTFVVDFLLYKTRLCTFYDIASSYSKTVSWTPLHGVRKNLSGYRSAINSRAVNDAFLAPIHFFAKS